VVRSLLDEDEIRRTAQPMPHFNELAGEQTPKERADTDVGEEIPAPPDSRLGGPVVALLGIVESAGHEIAECDRSTLGDFGAEA